ncbi:M57 family metalloprotease [Lactobacillus pasteurii]|uniref:Zn-dependent protease n=1 Tax=Lactobacillus pasteurii DSM 23907 = CRBIP 24.76 TaxID=1423790 RepID=I7KKA0_9LACO|nr:matrixin family metalloprotease [Lactobacillus pasteurii]TDG77892.1 hypothetical protein C5L33_001697 [Lactobacillus pasteurii]CCI84289.1 Zn-dependent protease [Lactobacillus pasteurii DSM 23907 = CRBIP 24.76]
MRRFFRFIRNLLLIGLIASGIWTYQHDKNIRLATNDSITTLVKRINQLINTGTLSTITTTSSTNKQADTSSDQDKNIDHQLWKEPQATVYLKLDNYPKLKQAALNAINIWNQTGAFTFELAQTKKKADIVISAMNDSDTSAAGQTSTTYNPITDHLISAKIQLNLFYLDNKDYSYNQARITNTVEHELGHAIGLNHTDKVSVMYPKGSYYTIQPRDIAAVKKLYQKK